MKIEEEKLHTRKLILGITGGIAAYKSAELVRLLIKAGYEVQVVMTKAACQFITSLTMQALSGKPVFTSMWDSSNTNGMSHIDLSRETDAILIAPASADFLYKLAHGRADDLLSTLCLARDCSLLVAPAMNKQMWENPATQRNIHQLRQDQVMIFGPDDGIQACGETGLGRMLEAPSLLKLVNAHFTPKLLSGKHVLITAGATLEMIDPVRAITNLSSGKKQGEISCFDIAYTLFADEENIPCLHFLLNDKKELMHDNQLVKIADFVNKNNIQFVASILKDKLPVELNDEKYFVVKLSQSDKLFRVENK